MDRIYASGAAGSPPSVPASPSSGYPTAGNPGTGTPATKPGPYWYHMITEELMAIISAAGVTPAPGTLTQLLTALRSAGVFQTQPTNDSSTKVATTAFANPGASLAVSGYQKLPSGLIIQWGTVTSSGTAANNATVTYPIAFPNAGLSALANITGSGSLVSYTTQIGVSTTTQLPITTLSNAAITSGLGVRWIAIGF